MYRNYYLPSGWLVLADYEVRMSFRPNKDVTMPLKAINAVTDPNGQNADKASKYPEEVEPEK